jgi:hypothetical protein
VYHGGTDLPGAGVREYIYLNDLFLKIILNIYFYF